MGPMSPAHLNKDDIVIDSIIENKERTKMYWTERMKAAENATATNTLIRAPSNTIRQSSVDSVATDGIGISVDDDDEPNVKEEKRRIEMRQIRQLANKNNDSHEPTMQEKIAREIQEQKEREEELHNMRKNHLATTIVSEIIENSEDRVSLDESNCSEYGSEEKEPSVHLTPKYDESMQYRAQSLESISSGMSSGSLISSGSNGNVPSAPKRRQVTVRPYDDPEFEPLTSAPVALFDQNERETPIEKETRLQREREAEWGRDHGSSLPVTSLSQSSGSTTLVRARKDALVNDTRDVQHRIATNRIQQEIEDTCEREMELRTEGKILTTSLETVDHKVTRFTQLAQQAIQSHSQNRTIRRATSQNVPVNQETVAAEPLRRVISTNTLSVWKMLAANKGKITGVQPEPKPQLQPQPQSDFDEPDVVRHAVPPTRNGYISAEEKIRRELRETEKLEEEWRNLHRSRALARSQPNLLTIGNDDVEMSKQPVGEVDNEIAQPVSLPTHYASNPNLTDTQQYQNKALSFNQKGYRKRFSLLEEWENRIQREQ